jgi:F-type H+-transporting ATPase subunit delta
MAAFVQLYARAFADVAMKSGLDLTKAMEELKSFDSTYGESRDLREVFGNPAVVFEQKLRLLDALCAKLGVSGTARNFLAVLLEHDRMSAVAEVIAETQLELDRRGGVAEAEVVTARELTSDERRELDAGIGKILGGSKVRTRYRLDSTLLGGALVRVGATVYDGSLKGQFQRLKTQLAAD